MARDRLAQGTQADTRSRLSDGSILPPPPPQFIPQTAQRPDSITCDIDRQPQEPDKGLKSAVESLTDRVSIVEERSKLDAGWFDKLAGVVDQQVPSIEARQKDQALQINELRTKCDDRTVDTSRAIEQVSAAGAIAKEGLETLSSTVRELKDEVHMRANARTTKLQDHEERLTSLEKQTQVEGAQKRQAEFDGLARKMCQLEKERNEESRKRDATIKKLDEVMERLQKLESTRIPSFSRPSSSTTNRTSTFGTVWDTRRGSVQVQERPKSGESRKRQASPTESPSRINTSKRAKAKGLTLSGTDNDSDEEPLISSQGRRTGDMSMPPTPSRLNKQSGLTEKFNAKQPTSLNGASTQKSKKKVKTESKAAGASKRTREATPEGLTKVARDRFHYIRELKDLDCTDFPKYKALRDAYLAATHQFPLFKLEIRNETYEFFLQTGEKDTLHPCPRDQVIGIPKESRQTDADREIVNSLGVLEACRFGPRGRVFEKGSSYYLLCLGEIYKYMQNTRNNKKETTGWFVFVDVAAKEKPVYMIWREKTLKDDKLVCTSNWSCSTLGLEPRDRRDFFVLLPSIKGWPKDPDQNAVSDERIKVVMNTHGQAMHMAFTRPLCEPLVQRMEEGWGKSVTFKETVRSKAKEAKNTTD
jgi:hypothetical protein